MLRSITLFVTIFQLLAASAPATLRAQPRTKGKGPDVLITGGWRFEGMAWCPIDRF